MSDLYNDGRTDDDVNTDILDAVEEENDKTPSGKGGVKNGGIYHVC